MMKRWLKPISAVERATNKGDKKMCNQDNHGHYTPKESEYLRLMLDTSPFSSHLWGKGIKLIDCNQATVTLFKLADKSEYMNKFNALMPEFQPDGHRSRERADRYIQTAFEKGRICFEWMHNTTDGEQLPCEVTLVRVICNNEPFVVAHIRDLREYKKMMQEIEKVNRENEFQLNKLNMIIKSTKIALWDTVIHKDNPVNPTNNIVYSNDFRRMLGYTDESDFPNVLGSWSDLLHPDDKERSVNAFAEHMLDTTGQTVFDIEYRLLKKNGEYAHFHDTGETVRDEHGIPLHTAGSVLDVTEIKNSLLILENILNNIDEFIYVTDIQTDKILFVNDAMKKHYNIKGDPVGQLCYKIFQEGVNERCEFCPCHQLNKSPYDVITWLEQSSVTHRTYRNTDRYINWIDNKMVHLQHSVDITELSQAKKQAESQRIEAETANKAKSEFLSHISHEIRTPMNAVLGTAEIQLQKETNSPDTQEAFNMIYNSGNLLLNIINDILDLSKIEAGKLEIVNAQYDIPSIIYDTVQLNLLRYESKPVEFYLKIDENTPLNLSGDELRIKQILNNIISNAFKYTDEGCVELSVSAKTTVKPDTNTDEHTDCVLIIKVSDTGQGMNNEQISRLFEEYSRFNMDTNRTIVGTGLGMHITKRLIEAMNGEISVKSRPGKGSLFTVELPQKQIGTTVCDAKLAQRLHSSRYKNMKLNKARIIHEYMPYGSVLIVDDVESNLYVAKGMMLPYGLEIETAISGFEAVDKIKNGREYDIVFMDYMMPKMNGLKTTQILRETGYSRPIIALTANAVAGSSAMFMSSGFDGYISKPIDLRELNTLLNRFIRDKQPSDVVESVREQVKSRKIDPVPAVKPQRTERTVSSRLALAVVKDVKNTICVLEKVLDGINCGDTDMELFTTTVHGMKSALANINEAELSQKALELEKAGGAGEINIISCETPVFINRLRQLIEKYDR
jgi:PAS domain S-box-containing protein